MPFDSNEHTCCIDLATCWTRGADVECKQESKWLSQVDEQISGLGTIAGSDEMYSDNRG